MEGFMARRIRDKDIESRAARTKLKARGKPYFKSIGNGLHIGYRKGKSEGKWVVRRYVGDQNYTVETIATADDITEADGVHVLDFWQAQDRAREVAGSKKYVGPYRVKDAIDAYLDRMGPDRNHLTTLRAGKHIIPKLGDKLVDDLTAEELRAWHRGMVHGDDADHQRKSKVSANRVLAMLKAALNLAYKNDKASSDKAWKHVDAFENVVQSRTRYLTLAECSRLLNACEPDFRKLVRGALETGARYGELGNLVCGDFNPDSGTVHIKKSKTGKERHIILTEDGAKFFASLVAGRPVNELMFGREWGPDDQRDRMRAACKNGRVEPRMSFHGLRHTWASHAVMAGMPLMVVARNLGHVDTRMVEKHYGHLSQSFVADQIRKFAPRFGQAEGNVKSIR
jgi:integrase